MSPNAGGGGVTGSLGQWVQLYTGAQIILRDPTQYLTYGNSLYILSNQGVTKRCRLQYLGWPIALLYMSPNAGGRGGVALRGLSEWVQLYTVAQINFGDVTPYLTYDPPNHLEHAAYDQLSLDPLLPLLKALCDLAIETFAICKIEPK